MLSNEQIRAAEEELRQKEAAEAARRIEQDRLLQEAKNSIEQDSPAEPQQEEPATPQQQETPAQAAQTAEKQKLERGGITEFGEQFREGIDPLNMADKAVQGLADLVPEETGVLKQAAQGLSDLVPSRDDVNQTLSGVPVLGQTAVAADAAMSVPSLPLAVGARVANQDASFYTEVPAQFKDTWFAEPIYQISQSIAAALSLERLMPGGTALSRSAAGITAEAAVDAIPVTSAEDNLLGVQAAQAFGELADGLGFDGGQATRDLIEGKRPSAQLANSVAATMQNVLMIKSFYKVYDEIAKRIGGKFAQPTEEVADTARFTNQSPDTVRKKIYNQDPIPDPWGEPFDNADINTIAGVSLPPEGKVVNTEALIAQLFRRRSAENNIVPDANNNLYIRPELLSDDIGRQEILKTIMRPLRRMRDFPKDLNKVFNNVQEPLRQMAELMGRNEFDSVMRLMIREGFIEPRDARTAIPMVKGEDGRYLMDSRDGLLKTVMKEYGVAGPEGMVAISVVGEEMAMRLKKVAQNIKQIDFSGNNADMTQLFELFAQLSDATGEFLVPMRRGKRKWALTGYSQQRKILRGLMDAIGDKAGRLDDTSFSRSKANETELDSAGRVFEEIRRTPEDEGFTVRELWEKWKGGDEEAGRMFKEYIDLIAAADSNAVLNQAVALNQEILRQFRRGGSYAGKSLQYASWLTGTDPIMSATYGNYLQLFLQPLGGATQAASKYARSKFLRGNNASDAVKAAKADWIKAWAQERAVMGSIFESLGVMKRSAIKGKSLYKASKFDSQTAENLARKGEELDAQWKTLRKEYPNNIGLWLNYTLQKRALMPMQYYATRGLNALDDAGLYLWARSNAAGEGAKMAFEKGIPVDEAISKSLKKIFKDGDTTKQIISKDIITSSNQLTFQTDIPFTPDTGPLQFYTKLENLFSGTEEFASRSDWAAMFLPFVRIGWNIFDFGVTGLASSLTPGFSKKLLSRHKRYKDILDGKQGKFKKQVMEAHIATSQLTAIAALKFAWDGGMTGMNQEPKQVIRIPNGKGGTYDIPYGRLPWSMQWAVLADMAHALRDGSESGRWVEEGKDLVTAISLASLDQAYLQGITNLTEFLDVGRLTTDRGRHDFLMGLAEYGLFSKIGAAQGITRNSLKTLQPYKTINYDETSFINALFTQLRGRYLGGVFNPVDYSIYTGRRIPKVSDPSFGAEREDGKPLNYWATLASSVADAWMYPGNITQAEGNMPYLDQMDFWGYKYDVRKMTREHRNLNLTPDEQSAMRKGMHDYGLLDARMRNYFAGKDEFKYKTTLNAYNIYRKNGDKEGMQAMVERVQSELNRIHDSAKQAAFANSPDLETLRVRVQSAEDNNQRLSSSMSPDLSQTGLIAAWGQGQASINQINNA